jgi:ubiquinone/menaquinone biosynthesis C-methylase UbiE
MREYDEYLRREWELFEGDPVRARASLEAVGGGPVSHVLDVGCGAGQELLPFVRERGAYGVGVDIAPDAGLAGRTLYTTRAHGAQVVFLRAEAEALPFAHASFDVVVCRLALPYTDNARALSEMARVLRAGGVLLLKIHHPRYYLGEAAEALAALSPLTFVHAARVLAAGTLYRITGRQTRSKLVSPETFQTEAMLRRELERVGLKIRREMPDSNPSTPSYLIEKIA